LFADSSLPSPRPLSFAVHSLLMPAGPQIRRVYHQTHRQQQQTEKLDVGLGNWVAKMGKKKKN